MASLFYTYKEKSAGVAIQQLKDHKILFLVHSGDTMLDREIESFIFDSFSNQYKIIQEFSASTQAELMDAANKGIFLLFPDFRSYLDKLDSDDLQSFIQLISNAEKWTSNIIFQLSEGINEVDSLLNKLAEINYVLIKSLHVISRVPDRLYNELILDSLSKHGIEVDNETADAMQRDQKSFSLSYTYTQLFVEKVLIHFQKTNQKGNTSRSLDIKEYESVGTLRYFIEYACKSFLAEAESFSSFQQIEYVFRSLLLFKNDNPQRAHLTQEQVSLRSGIPIDEVVKILELGCDKKHQIIVKSNDLFSISSEEYLIHWSDLKKWISSESEAIELYHKYSKLADAYEKGETQLLNGIQLEETDKWKQFNPVNLYWASSYNPAFEKVLSYLTTSEQAFQEYLAAQERSRSRRLKTAYSIASASVVGLMVILVLWFQAQEAKKNAEKAQEKAKQEEKKANKNFELAKQSAKEAKNAELVANDAKGKALQEAKNALDARAKEEQQKTKAIEAGEKAIKARDDANQAKDEASRAKDLADKNREKAEEKEKEAKENYGKAEQLRIQQEARANALSVFEEYDNKNFIQGRKKASEAYTLYKKQGGNPYEKDILNSLFVGLIREDVKLFKLDLDYQPSKMCMNASMDKIAVYGLDAFLRVYDLKNQRKQIESIKVDKVIGMGYVKEKLILLQPNGLILHDGATNTKLPMADMVGKTFKEFFINTSSNENTIYISTDNALLLYQYKNGEPLKLIKSIAVNHSSNFKKGKSEVFFSADNQLFSASDNGTVMKKILTIKNNITAISSPLTSGLVALGDEQGNIYLIDPKTSQIKSERNKLHLSKISGLEVLHTHGGTEILSSVGLDWALNIFYLADLQSNSLPTPITLKEHKGWITNLIINNNSNQALTSSYDRTIRFWPLLPEQLIYNSSTPTSNKKSTTNE